MTLAAVTNVAVGKAIGLAHSSISRIRSGDRTPSLDIMLDIEREFGWSVRDQAIARREDKYASEFEKILIQRYGALSPVAS